MYENGFLLLYIVFWLFHYLCLDMQNYWKNHQDNLDSRIKKLELLICILFLCCVSECIAVVLCSDGSFFSLRNTSTGTRILRHCSRMKTDI